MIDPITLQLDGINYTYWDSCQVTRQIDAIAGAFSLTLADKWADGGTARALEIVAGMSCKVIIGDDVVIDGYIDKATPQFGPTEHGISVSGRDKTGDMVDCAAIHKPGQWSNLTVVQLAEILAKPFGIKVRAEGDVGAPIDKFKLEQGEKAFDALDRALKQREILAYPDNEGGLILAKVGASTAAGELLQGYNILRASLDSDLTDRFSDYIVQGQQPGNDERYGLAACAVTAETKDPAITRYRPLIVRPDKQGDVANAKQRAAWECSVRKARSVTVNVTVQGFRQEGFGDDQSGDLWQINQLVDCSIPYLRIEQKLLVAQLVFDRSLSNGSTTQLTLRDPAAFQPEPKASESKSAGAKSGNAPVKIERDQDIQTRMANEAKK